MKLTASALALAATLAADPRPLVSGRLALSPDGASAWLLDRYGGVSLLEIPTGRRIPWSESEHAAAGFSDIAPSPDGRTLYALAPAADGKTTLLIGLSAEAREETVRWEVRGEGRLLAVTPDGARACVVGLRPAAARRRDAPDEEDWTLTILDLATGTAAGPLPLGLQPRAIALVEAPGGGAKIYLAARDRLATYQVEPLRASWFYKSPGDSTDVAGVDGSPALCLLRGSSLAIIDPRIRTREGGRVQLSDDDATSVARLPARGRALALARDGSVAAVLHEDGLGITWVDVASAAVMKTEPLPGARDLIAGRLREGDGGLRALLASSEGPAGGILARAADRPAAPRAERAPQPPAPPPVLEEAAQTDRPREPEEPLEPQPPPAAPAPPVELARPSVEAALTGRLTGEVAAAREVRLYGPDNILKLHARAPVAPDGRFRLPLPPPGSYRVVVSAGPGAHLFTRPEFRTILVGPEATGLEGIDFEVRGKL